MVKAFPGRVRSVWALKYTLIYMNSRYLLEVPTKRDFLSGLVLLFLSLLLIRSFIFPIISLLKLLREHSPKPANI